MKRGPQRYNNVRIQNNNKMKAPAFLPGLCQHSASLRKKTGLSNSTRRAWSDEEIRSRQDRLLS